MTVAAILLTLLAAGQTDADAAYADWQRLGRGHYAYATVGTERSEQAKERLAGQLAFTVASLSSKSYLADQLPVKVTENVYRLNLQGLGWEKMWPVVLLQRYPYRADLALVHRYPLMVNANWIVADLTDPTRTGDAQQLLLYGRAIKTEKEFKAFWKVQGDKELFYGRIENQSGVANELVRLIENQPAANRTSHWQTFDSRVVAGRSDPLETLGKALQYDASELIAAIPKHYAGRTGTLQAYFLSNAKGEFQAKAPADIVTDHTGLRGPEIVNTQDCLSCHTPASGLIDPTLDGYREFVLGGAKVYADYTTKQRIEAYLQSDMGKEMSRGREDYTEGVKLVTGLTPDKCAANFIACVKAYDAPVDLQQAAREVGISSDSLRLAIGHYSPTGKLSARLAALPYQAMSRRQWELSQRQLLVDVLPYWRAK